MTPLSMPIVAAMAASVWVASAGSAPVPAAQELDAEEWAGLVQMPVAVARLDLAGVPRTELKIIVSALNGSDLKPTAFLGAMRGLPVIWRRVGEGDRESERERAGQGDGQGDGQSDGQGYGKAAGTGTFVQAMHARGLRGRELVDAIREEVRQRGMIDAPANGPRGIDVLHRDWVPDDRVDPRFRDDPLFAPGKGRPRLFGAGG